MKGGREMKRYSFSKNYALYGFGVFYSSRLWGTLKLLIFRFGRREFSFVLKRKPENYPSCHCPECENEFRGGGE
jgi:hypothetical protein